MGASTLFIDHSWGEVPYPLSHGTTMKINTSFVDHNWGFLRSHLPSGWESLARETKAILQFKGDVKSVPDWMRIFLIHLAGGYSLEETATRAKLAGLGSISDVALMKRLQNSGEWFHRMGLQLIAERGIQLQTQVGFNLKLIDGSVVKEPGKTGSEWRLHYALTVPDLRCDHFELTPVKGTGTGETLMRFPVAPGDCLMGDRAYATVKNVEYVHEHKGDIIVRMNHQSLPLYSSDDLRFNLLGAVATLTKPGQTGEWQVEVHSDERIIPGRLCVVRKDDEAIRKALKRLNRRGQKKGNEIQPETKEFAKYIMVFTTLSKEILELGSVLELYRFRWQIELAFKRFKSLAQLGHIPKHSDLSAKAWLYGKLFICLLTEKLVSMADFFSPWGVVDTQQGAGKA
jgi:hypothetical protein